MPLSALQSELSGKRIFITGGTGVIGKWLLQELEKVSCELVLLTRNPVAFNASISSFPKRDLALIQGDIQDFKFPEGDFDYIIHAATPVVSDAVDNEELNSIIVSGTSRVLEFSARSSCPRMLYVSSGAVYGNQPTDLDRIPESYACVPVSVYGRAKLAAEKLCLSSGVNCVIARCFSFVGQGIPFDAHFAIGNFIGNCLRDEPIIIKGDGTPFRSYMYASDLVDWLLTIMISGDVGGAYNVGSSSPISIGDLAMKVRDLASSKSLIEVLLPFDDQKLVQRYVPCIDKATQSLSLEVKVDLDAAIRETLMQATT